MNKFRNFVKVLLAVGLASVMGVGYATSDTEFPITPSYSNGVTAGGKLFISVEGTTIVAVHYRKDNDTVIKDANHHSITYIGEFLLLGPGAVTLTGTNDNINCLVTGDSGIGTATVVGFDNLPLSAVLPIAGSPPDQECPSAIVIEQS